MSFKMIDGEPNRQYDEFLPWAEQYLLENPDKAGQVFLVKQCKIRPKGIIAETEDFSIFFFKSSKEFKVLFKHQLDNNVPKKAKSFVKYACPSPAIMLVNSRPFGKLGFDDEEHCLVITDDEAEDLTWTFQKVSNSKASPDEFDKSEK